MSMPHKYLIKEFEDFAHSARSAEPLMQYVSERIHKHIPRYNWVGFYALDKKDAGMLVLGPHTGSFTPSQQISLDQGLCGLAASSGRMVVVDNVADDPQCLVTYDLVKSQIAAPIAVRGRAAVVLYVESYFMATFRPAPEREFVEKCARIVGSCLERTLAADLVHA